ncbi:biotin/lipoate A/B protein ligase family protein [Thermodesulfobacteriota bacterium]
MYDIRVVTEPEDDIFYHMATDESLFLFSNKSDVSGTLRVYMSKRPGITYGYFQNITDLNFDYLNRNKIDYVRRITGGRAVIHGDDLTFSFAANRRSHLFDRSISKITAKFSIIIKRFLESLELSSTITKNDTQSRDIKRNPFCFSSYARNEIAVHGNKIVGYALKRDADSFLLQGSIPIGFDEELFKNLFVAGDEKGVSREFTCLNDIAKERYDFITLREIFLSTFSECGFEIHHDNLAKEEAKEAIRLKGLKYCNPVWNQNRKEFQMVS